MRKALCALYTHSDLNDDDMPSKTLAARCVNRGAFDIDLMTERIIGRKLLSDMDYHICER